MTRQTSIDCYNQIKAEGLLSKTRLKIYSHFLRGTCLTAKELEHEMNYSYAHQRLSEMRELGVIYEKRIRQCRVTGRQSIEWDLTDNLPSKKTKLLSLKEQKKENALEALRDLWKDKDNQKAWQNVAKLIQEI